MPQNPPRAAAGRYRYLVLFASFMMLAIGTGSVFALAVALKDIAATFGWPRTVPSLGYSMQFLGAGIGGIAMGHWLDRSGMSKPALIGAVMIGSGAIATSQITAAWQLLTVYGLMMGMLGHATLFAPMMANVTRWFTRKRGMAVGVVASGQTIAGAIWPPILGYLNQSIGWREMFFWYGVFALATMLPLALVFRRRPESVVRHVGSGTENAASASQDAAAPEQPTLSISPSRLQTVLCVAVIGCCVAMSMPLAHLFAHATDLGHAPARAAEILAVMLAASTVGRAFGIGLLTERFGGLGALFMFSALQAVSLAILIFTDGLIALYVVAAAFGLGYAGVIPCYAISIREHLPPAEGGRRTGTVLFFGTTGMAIGSARAGGMFDLTGGYTIAFAIGVAFNIGNLAIIGTLLYHTRRRTQGVMA
jgi:MFS family permease